VIIAVAAVSAWHAWFGDTQHRACDPLRAYLKNQAIRRTLPSYPGSRVAHLLHPPPFGPALRRFSSCWTGRYASLNTTSSWYYTLPPGTREGAIIRYYRHRLRGKWKLTPSLSAYPFWAVFQLEDVTLTVSEEPGRSWQPRVWLLTINYARLSPDSTALLERASALVRRRAKKN
jgi:hypothetical protein